MQTQILTIPKYIREVKLSNARTKKYYELGKTAPKAKKYHDKSKYDYQLIKGMKTRKFLIDLSTGERVIANPKAAGTPRVMTINGQQIYNGAVGKHTRNKLMMDIKAFFKEYVETLDPITDYPIKLTCELHDTIHAEGGTSLWDLDNRAMPYIKAFQDCLTGDRGKCKKIILDDNILFVTQPPIPKFIPVENTEDRKLVFIIEKETDKRITENKIYTKLCKAEIINLT